MKIQSLSDYKKISLADFFKTTEETGASFQIDKIIQLV